MIDPRVIKNYASSLFDNINSDAQHELVLKQITLMSQVLTSDPDIHFAFCAPIVSRLQKLKLIELLHKKFNFEKIVSQFFSIIIKNARFNILPEILSEYEKLLSQKRGVKIVTVQTVNILTEKELDIIKKYLENKLKKNIEFKFQQDQSLIGGVIIKYDSMLYDYSISGAIDRAENLAKNVVLN